MRDFKLDIDFPLLHLDWMGPEARPDRRALGLARRKVKPPVVLRAFGDVPRNKAVG